MYIDEEWEVQNLSMIYWYAIFIRLNIYIRACCRLLRSRNFELNLTGILWQYELLLYLYKKHYTFDIIINNVAFLVMPLLFRIRINVLSIFEQFLNASCQRNSSFCPRA